MRISFSSKLVASCLLFVIALGAAACSSPAAAPVSGVDGPTGRSIKVYESPT